MSVALLQIELKRNQKLAEAARLESKQKMDALLKAATQKARAVTLLSPFALRPSPWASSHHTSQQQGCVCCH